jgi:hypothetical protein
VQYSDWLNVLRVKTYLWQEGSIRSTESYLQRCEGFTTKDYGLHPSTPLALGLFLNALFSANPLFNLSLNFRIFICTWHMFAAF